MEKTEQTFTLKLTAAVVIDGEIASAGDMVELSRKEAENLLGRGMAQLANPEQLAALEAEEKADEERVRKEQEAAIEAQKADQVATTIPPAAETGSKTKAK